MKRVLASPQLPTLPVIAMKVLELTRRENVSVPEIASVIMMDPALTSRILKTVNSPFYGVTKQVATVSSALVILGLQAAKTLALGFSLLSNLRTRDKGEGAFDHTQFWKRCTYSAVASRVIARKLSVIQQEEAFLAGLMANIGELVLHRVMPDEFDVLFAEAKGDQQRLAALCQEKLGADPVEVSALVAEKWQLPPMLLVPITHQNKRDQADPAIRPLVEAVSAGLYAAGVFVAEDSAKAIAEARQELTARLSLPAAEIEAIMQEIGASAKDAALMLDLQIGQNRSYQEILDEAQEALVHLSLQTQKQVQVIQKEVETLQVKATTDPLTGLANRARFDEFFEQQFQRAFTHQRPLSLIIIDIDHFKKVNDTHGHQGGDEVLRHVGRLLRNAVRNIDLAARYGGEEFALVLTETDTAVAAQRAEGIRTRLAAEVVEFGEIKISVTMSAGVAGTDRGRVFKEPAQLTNAADRAVYAAKAAGRNCIRVFKPKSPAAEPSAPAASAAM
jgi:diguanylate cyclase (GGDEF)-like protein